MNALSGINGMVGETEVDMGMHLPGAFNRALFPEVVVQHDRVLFVGREVVVGLAQGETVDGDESGCI